ncbi:MAG: hypothetical protein WCE52_05630 [Candidatus Acidiferrum sp.]
MRYRKLAQLAVIVSLTFGAVLNASEDQCERTAPMRVFSNAYFVKEAGDVVGYELGVQQREGSAMDALLYVYEGVPNKDGISVSGRIDGEKLAMEGDWVQHLVEHPSMKEIVETHHVTVSGTLTSNLFRGTINIAGLGTKVKLKRVKHIWIC